MGETMEFPAIFDEFAEQYKIIDKYEVYTNGTELIPKFRVKQWLDNVAQKSIVRLDIVDNDADYSERLQATFYLVNPDEAKLRELKRMVENRFEEENPFTDSFIAVEEFIEKNFETVEIETKEIQW